jgi:glycosyltransferase involved in cell wall biosynthesis
VKELTILLPCLNEAVTIAICVKRALKLIADNHLDGEVLISDNGSTDGSQEIATKLGARVITCSERGYGAALQWGIENADGEFVLMGDADDSYHFEEAMPMIRQLREGYDVSIGSRLKGKIMPEAMPFMNRYIGNPVLSGLGKVLFNIPVTDFHCGMRAFRRDKVLDLNLVTTGMEWASEMIIKAKLAGLRIAETPITLYKDGRNRPPHLRRWRDGWRHLRFMLLHAPSFLFVLPGLLMVLGGLAGSTLILSGVFSRGPVVFDVQSLMIMSFMLILGVQVVFTGLFANIYSHITGILPYNERFDRIVRKLSLEKLLVISLIVGFSGACGLLYSLWQWYKVNFSELNNRITLRTLIPSLTMIAISVQGVFNGFMLSILFLKTKASKVSDILNILNAEESAHGRDLP